MSDAAVTSNGTDHNETAPDTRNRVKGKRDPILAALPPAVQVRRFEEAEKMALAPYIAAINEAQRQLNMAFTLFVTGKGIDLSKVDVQMTPDGAGWYTKPKPRDDK